MAVIHKGRTGLKRRLRAARTLMLLCWPLAAAAIVLTAVFYFDCFGMMLKTAGAWRDTVAVQTAVEGAGNVHGWMNTLAQLWAMARVGLGWCVFGLTVAAPGLLGLAAAVLLICLHRPSMRRCHTLRMQVRGERAAMAILRQLPDACHIFLGQRLVFDGGTSEMDAVVVGPGGTAVIDVKNWSGLIEGCVTEAVLYRKRQDGTVDKLRNPARQVVGHVTRLSAYLRSVNVSAGVVPCVLFVSPEASVYVTAPEDAIISERRIRVSSCIMADTTSFWELLGRELAGGRHLNHSAVEQVVAAISKAPRGKRRCG